MNMIDSQALREQVANFKRAGELEQATKLLTQWMAQEEAESAKTGSPVASYPYEQAALIARKQKRLADEIAVLERYTQQRSSGSKQGKALYERLQKAYMLSEQPKPDDHPLFVRKALLIDTETTGLSAKDEVIEVALLLFGYSLLSGRVLGLEQEYTSLRQPSLKIPRSATAIHGITDKDVRGKKLDDKQIKELVASADILVAHNASFDRRMLAPLFPDITQKIWYCTMSGINWAQKGCSGRGLENLLSHFNIPEAQVHRASADAHQVLTLLGQIDNLTQQTFFAELLASPPFGYASTYAAQNGKVNLAADHEDKDLRTTKSIIEPKPTKRSRNLLGKLWRVVSSILIVLGIIFALGIVLAAFHH
ncbi:MAG: exonuclease domain-containing protein [Caldilineaceae bacterium]